jgi:hypothetical protein
VGIISAGFPRSYLDEIAFRQREHYVKGTKAREKVVVSRKGQHLGMARTWVNRVRERGVSCHWRRKKA